MLQKHEIWVFVWPLSSESLTLYCFIWWHFFDRTVLFFKFSVAFKVSTCFHSIRIFAKNTEPASNFCKELVHSLAEHFLAPVNKPNNYNVNYLKIPKQHRGQHKMPSRATCLSPLDWTLENNMVDGLFCATLTGRRRGHNPICTSRSGNIRHRCGCD